MLFLISMPAKALQIVIDYIVLLSSHGVVTGGSEAAPPVRWRPAGALAGRAAATWRPQQCRARLVAARDWPAGVSRLGAG